MNLYRITLTASLLFISMFFSSLCFSDYVVIVHPSNENALSEEQIAKIFLDKRSQFPDGLEAIPLTYLKESDISSLFASRVLKKTNIQLKAYWARLVFTGRGDAPLELAEMEKIKALTCCIYASPMLCETQ